MRKKKKEKIKLIARPLRFFYEEKEKKKEKIIAPSLRSAAHFNVYECCPHEDNITA